MSGPLYPHVPGHRRQETSILASDKAAPKVRALHERILSCLKELPKGATTDRLAMMLGENERNLQPRTSELYNLGLIAKSPRRGVNRRGNTVRIWVHKDHSEGDAQ